MSIQEVLDLITMIFDTIKKYILLVFGLVDDLEKTNSPSNEG